MTARQILNIKPGQKIGLGNGLRVVCDKRNGLRFFELRKRVRGKDYSWGVGTADSSNIAGCDKALASARQQAQKIVDAIDAGADPAGIGKSAKSGEVLTGRSPLRDVARQYVANKGGEWTSDRHRANWLNSLEQHCKWLMDSPVGEITLDTVVSAIQPHWAVRTETASRMRAKLSRILSYAVVLKLRNDDPADWKLLSHVLPQKAKIAPVQHRVAMDYMDCPDLYARLPHSELSCSFTLRLCSATSVCNLSSLSDLFVCSRRAGRFTRHNLRWYPINQYVAGERSITTAVHGIAVSRVSGFR